jgi:hypothetical protein
MPGEPLGNGRWEIYTLNVGQADRYTMIPPIQLSSERCWVQIMSEYRVSFGDIEDEVAQLKLYKDGEFEDYLRYRMEELPEEATKGDQFRPIFDDGEIVELRYDEELTEQEREKGREAVERYKEMLDDS